MVQDEERNREVAAVVDLWREIVAERVASFWKDVRALSTIRAVYTVGAEGYTKSDFSMWDSEKPRKLVRYIVQRLIVWEIVDEKTDEFLAYLDGGPKLTHPFRGMSDRQNETRILAEGGKLVSPGVVIGSPKGWLADRSGEVTDILKRLNAVAPDVDGRVEWTVSRLRGFLVQDLEAFAKGEAYLVDTWG